MLECEGCHRHVHATESSCPFCAAPLASAAGLASAPMVALAAGLSLLGCTQSGGDSGDSNAVTTDPSTSESASTSTSTSGDGDGDGDTQDTLDTLDDYSGSAYGGPPPCDDLADAIPLTVGSNAVDTSTSGGNDITTNCMGLLGNAPERMLEFVSPAAGHFTFAIMDAIGDNWLLQSGYYCYAYDQGTCVPNQSLGIDLAEGETLYLILDGTTDFGGPATIDVTQG
jgi:hypothetical protein